jgi:hypothetical protein
LRLERFRLEVRPAHPPLITYTIRISIEPRLHGLKEVLLAEAAFSIDARSDRVRQIDCDAGFLASPEFPLYYGSYARLQSRWPQNQSLLAPARSCEIAMKTSANEIHYLLAMLLTLPNG